MTLKETILRRSRVQASLHWALRNVDLDIRPGESVGVIGENGAGKSTLLKLVGGIIPPQTGTIETCGRVVSMLELGAGFHPDFSGRENVFMNAAILGLHEREIRERFDEIVAFSEVGSFIDMPVKNYSSGMQMRLAFAIAVHVNCDILLLDEVLAVGDEAFQRKCYGRMFEFLRRGGTMLFVSHDATAIERVCRRVLLVAEGAIVADGPPQEVLAEYHKRFAAHSSEAGDGVTDVESDTTSPAVRIEAVRVVGPDGPTDNLRSGEPAAIELDVAVHGSVDSPVFGIAIHSVDGALMYGTNNRLDSLSFGSMASHATVRFAVPHLHLHEGRFQVTAAAHSNDESVLFHWLDRVVDFNVFQSTTGVGVVDLSGVWSLEERTREQRTESGEGEGT